ncbi:uncharacterized protein (DUF2141 family) [Rhodoligotrophos appendicifer]|uniref:DUF2141 domain-containing protein n=1 Tax=Rhodoligotrophos appendicifer TaxID=987056 RepID=UPI001186D3F8|nr:DUF2141 domain-containing protein [Rhodoligotrophos appendicifer]
MTRSSEQHFSSCRTILRGCLAAVLLGATLSGPVTAQTAAPPAATTTPAPVQAPNTTIIDLTVDGLQSDDGMLLWTLFQGEENFESFDPEKSIAKGKCQIVNKVCTVQIPAVPFGEYALIVAHDVDGNGEIDRNPLSDELKGISNYTSKLWWKPNWDDAKFTASQPQMPMTITVY